MNAPVDVLAVMEAMTAWARLRADPEWTDKADEARAAIAELIESAGSVDFHQEDASPEQWDRFRNALARVKGGAA